MISTIIKTKFRPSSPDGRKGSIVYAVIRHRETRIIATGYEVHSDEWDEAHSAIKVSLNSSRCDICVAIARKIQWDGILFRRIVSRLENDGMNYSAHDVVVEFHRLKNQQSFFTFMRGVIERMKLLGHDGTCHNYTMTLKSFCNFRNNQDLDLQEITSSLIEEYHAWLSKKGVKSNSISFYMRNLRATYNRAVEQGLVADSKPFAKTFTGNEKTMKRAISLTEIKMIKDLDLSAKPALGYARDIFLFLFYCRGMSLIDAAYLRHSNIIGNEIIYRRRKTNQQLTVGLNKHINTLINRYNNKESPFLLPILKGKRNDWRSGYDTALRNINNSLKRIGRILGISIPLTTYVSRHSWASIAKEKGIPISIISDALGHDSEQTTQIYLSSICGQEIDRANSMILDSL